MNIPPRPRYFAIEVAAGAVALVLSVAVDLVFLSDMGGWVPPSVALTASIIVAVIMWASATIARWMPHVALTAAWGGAVLQMGVGLWPMVSNLAVLGVLFATAAWGSRRVMTLGGISALVGGLIAGMYSALRPGALIDDDLWHVRVVVLGGFLSALFIAALIISWGSGLLWRLVRHGRATREAQVRAEALAASEAERSRIARDMHDVVAHSLAVVIAQADGARYVATQNPDAATAALTTIATTARSALADVRTLLTQLRHRQAVGPQPMLVDLDELFQQVTDSGRELAVTVEPEAPGEPAAALQMAVYRIVQEALTNALRHGSDTAPITVRLAWWADAVDIVVANPVAANSGVSRGRGADSDAVGHGIIGMTERAQLVGGTLTTERRDNTFVVTARIPVGSSE
ncbi:sensor histidine kinase [Microbacterium sp. YY-01]|uniref:sensor histidine kinase n=1 Tax=Microbacterium sp. YY-01 TaxID=3421634 RepID=UPI003D163E3D